MGKLIQIFTCSCGAILLFNATAIYFGNFWSTQDLVSPKDPFFQIPATKIWCFVCVAEVTLAAVCFFYQNPTLPNSCIMIYSANFLGLRLYLSATGLCVGFKGYMGGLAAFFGMTGSQIETGWILECVYFFIGACGSLWWDRRKRLLKGF
jgi:hypothetical protein